MILASPTLLFLFEAFQAGGGGSFGGGGGGSSDGDGFFWIFYWLLRLALEVPIVGVPLLIIAIVIAIVGSRQGWWKVQEHTIARSVPQRHALTSATMADQLRAIDPTFDERQFLGRVRSAFRKAQAGWCAHDLEALRPFVSDGVFERFSLQIEEQKLDGWRQGMDQLRVQPACLVHFDSGAHFETVSVRIDFAAEIHRIDRVSAKQISGSVLPRTSFSECWSFVRRRGTRSVSKQGLMEGFCPNCGAPLAMNQSARCGQCECLVRSGQFDWVLSEITQMSEWRATPRASIPGLAAYLDRDPGFDAQMLEDRASIAFWRKCAADRSGEVSALSRIATPNLCEHYLDRLRSKSRETRVFRSDCAVGSVETLAVLAGDATDRAVVEVVSDGRSASIAADGRLILGPERHLRRTLFVFSRKVGESTRIEDTFTTATCRNCGAHDAGGTTPECSFCGAPRTGDGSTWLVSEIVGRGTSEADTLLAELKGIERAPETVREVLAQLKPNPASAAGLLQWATALVRADGEIDGRERRAVYALAKRLDVSEERANDLLENHLDGSGPNASDREEAQAWFKALVELAMDRGSLSRVERGFLTHAAHRLTISQRETEHALRSTRSKLYSAAREARKLGAAD